MDLKDLIAKMTAIEEGAPVAPTKDDGPGVDECGGIMIGGPMGAPMGQPKQPDNVTMSVNMNGQGAGGIKDLMNILRSIEHAEAPTHGIEHDHGEPLFGDEFEETMGDDKETWGNSAHGDAGAHVHGVDAVTFSGNDMNSKGNSNPHFSPGNNTLRQSTTMHEGLVERLQSLYNEVKTRDLNENVITDHTGHTMQHILHTHMRDVKDFETNGDLSDSLYDVLYDYYFDDMPYGVKKARDGDPYEWISDRFAQDLGINETIEENQAGHDYQTGEPLKQGPDGKWRNSKGEERDPLNGGPINSGGGAKFRSIMSVPVKEERTEEKDEKGNVVRWKEEGEWVKAKDKEGRGKVTNLSDKARRESEKLAKDEKISEWGVNLTQPQADLFGKAPAEYNDKANVTAMTAKYDAMIANTQKEIENLKANPTGPGSDGLMKSLQDHLKGLEAEKMHNLTGTSNDDATNALRKQAIANNELTPGQWLQKGTQYVKGKVTGKPQPGVSYDRYDTSHQAEKDWTAPTPFKPGTGLEESVSRILELNKKLNG